MGLAASLGLGRYQQDGKVVMESGSWTITARKAA
jgi:hypothetical protein